MAANDKNARLVTEAALEEMTTQITGGVSQAVTDAGVARTEASEAKEAIEQFNTNIDAAMAEEVVKGGEFTTALNAQIGEALPSVSANTYGASPAAAWEVNRDAFQAALEAVEAAGGGVVTADPGVYAVKGVERGSHTTLDMPGVTLRSPDGQAPGVLASKQYTTTGTATGSTVTVDDTTGFEFGTLVGIQAAAGHSPSQNTLLASAIDATQTAGITLTERGGFPASGYMAVGSEVIRYTGISTNTLTGVTRGVFGTTAVSHGTALPIGMAARHYAVVTAVSGNTLTLSTPTVLDVSGVEVTGGPISTGIRPGLEVDGNAPSGGATASVHAVSLSMERRAKVDGLSVRNTDQGGFTLQRGSRDNRVTDLHIHDGGIPAVSKGGALWLYQSCESNNISGVTITGDTWVSIYLDDRTSIASEWDGPNDHNKITGINIDVTIPDRSGFPAALNIVGSNHNTIMIGTIRGANIGFTVGVGQQATTHDGVRPTATGNEIGSLYMSAMRSQPWLVDATGNVLHDIDWEDTYSSPVTEAGNLIYASKIKNGGAVENTPRLQVSGSGAPSLAVDGDPDTGVFSGAANTIGLSAGGTSAVRAFATETRFYENGNAPQKAHASGFYEYSTVGSSGGPAGFGGKARTYTRTNGSGKLELCVQFPSGAAQVIATEP